MTFELLFKQCVTKWTQQTKQSVVKAFSKEIFYLTMLYIEPLFINRIIYLIMSYLCITSASEYAFGRYNTFKCLLGCPSSVCKSVRKKQDI